MAHVIAAAGLPCDSSSVMILLIRAVAEKAAPALTIRRPPARRARTPARYGTAMRAARAPMATTSLQSPWYASLFFGAEAVMPITPAMIATVARASRRPTRSCSIREPRNRSRTRPSESVGCTSVIGASENASSWNGQPRIARPVASAQRGRRRSRVSIERRIPRSVGMSRASSAWNAMAPSKQAAAAHAAAKPARSSPWIIDTILA